MYVVCIKSCVSAVNGHIDNKIGQMCKNQIIHGISMHELNIENGHISTFDLSLRQYLLFANKLAFYASIGLFHIQIEKKS